MALAKDFQTALAAKATFSRPLKPIGLLADGCLVVLPEITVKCEKGNGLHFFTIAKVSPLPRL